MKGRLNYLESKEDIFYKIIYPIYSKEFLFGSDYELFCETVQDRFILNNVQWGYILDHWNEKKYILN